MNTRLILAAAAAAAASTLSIAAPAAAETIVYKATNHSGGKHGLWTNPGNGWADPYFSFQNDMTFTVDTVAGTGTLVGTAINGLGQTAAIDFSFGGFLETTQGSGFAYKREGGGAYDPATDTPDIDFFTTGAGTVDIDGTVYTLQLDPFPHNYTLQFGQGANAKSASDFGGAAWLLVQGQNNHWDINFNLSAVPEPGTWLLMILGFGAIGASMRAKKTKVATRIAYS